jgi:hypothetical protein
MKDRLKNKNIHLKYCLTGKMIADFFTKPLQGALFRKLRGIVMGHAHISTLWDATSPTPQECVGRDDNGNIDNEPVVNVQDVQRLKKVEPQVRKDISLAGAKRSYAEMVKVNKVPMVS